MAARQSPCGTGVSPVARATHGVLCCIACVLLACCTASEPSDVRTEPDAAASAPAERSPFFDARTQTPEYAGPGREDAPPSEVDEVRIGWFGPSDPAHATAGQMWQAASMAIEEANAAGGYRGVPIRLVPVWSGDPWGSGIAGVTRLVYDEGVWAIVGAPDGPSAHLVEQVVAKARLAFISPVSTDKTTNLVNVPWIFSCAPSDDVLAPPLAREIVSEAAGRDFAVVSCIDHDSRLFVAELLAAFHAISAFPVAHLEYRGGEAAFDRYLQRLRQTRPAVVALIAGPRDAARFLIAMRRAGLWMPVFGGPSTGHRVFVEEAGHAAEGVVFPLLWAAADDRESSVAFARRFEDRFGIMPDYTAAYTYDAVNLIVDAIRKAGLNRALIRDAVRELSPWHGVTGEVRWGPTGRNIGRIGLGIFRQGRVSPVPSPR